VDLDEQKKIEQAKLTWDENTPSSAYFNDIYFSPKDGLAETQYVFLENNQLESRWKNLGDNENFTIAESGFGTGLNFLASCQLWNSCFKNNHVENRSLNFISFEKYPLSIEDLEKAHCVFPTLSDISQQLRDHYPKLISGVYRIHLINNISLTLIFGDALYALKEIKTKVDVWFFDGFSPKENPQLWSEAFFNQTHAFNKVGTTFSTFTSAGHVKRKLQGIGFTTHKVKGFGNKREMLIGEIKEQNTNDNSNKKILFSYSEKPWLIKKNATQYSNKNTVIIIGSGLAGAWSAYKFAERGFSVTVIDESSGVATGASSNPRGATYFKLRPEQDQQSEFYISAYLYSISQLNNLLPDQKSIWNPCGLLQMAFDDKQLEKFKRLENIKAYQSLFSLLNSKHASKVANTSLTYPALFFKDAGSVDPQALCKRLLSHKNIKLMLNIKVDDLQKNSLTKKWLLYNKEESLGEADIVVLANSYHASQFEQSQTLPLFKVRGQSTQLLSNEKSKKLQVVVCSKGYLTPSYTAKNQQDEHTIGSTFDPKNHSTEISENDNQCNLDYLQTYTPNFYKLLSANKNDKPKVTRAKAALRCQTPDNLPILGQLIDTKQFDIDFAGIAKGQLKQVYPAASYIDGLYINTGHGSRGLISTPLCAELLVNEILGETPACGLSNQDTLSPSRYNLRALKKKK
jgi:tRNA 5-methylaminomethyl-2-thiouridine biosynthesis bifunctional protein